MISECYMNNDLDLSDIGEAIELCCANAGRNIMLNDSEINRILESIGEIDTSEISEETDICAHSTTSTSVDIEEVSSEPSPILATAPEIDSQADLSPTHSDQLDWRKRNPKRDPWCFGRPGCVDLGSATCRACNSASDCKEVAARTETQRFKRVAARLIRESQPVLARSEDPADLAETVALTIERNRASALPMLHSVRDFYVARHNRAKAKYQEADRDYQRKKRAKASREGRIAKDHMRRLRALGRPERHKWEDKRLEQLRGREEEIALFWKSLALAHLKHGPNVSDAKVAEGFRALSGTPVFTRHQARSRRRLIAELERPGGVWDFRGDAP